MAGPNTGKPECDDLLGELHDLLHGDLDPSRKAKLQAHLEDCPPCFETADFQAQLRQIVAKRCSEQVPDALQSRILSMLQVEIRDSSAPGTSP
jgi:anti-sigma factor (TIGR02949 family)